MKEAKPVRFRQIAVMPTSANTFAEMYAVDLSGRLWCCSLESPNGLPYPVDELTWVQCAMPKDEQP